MDARDDCFGQFRVRVSCVCGASRHIEPEALARLVAWSMTLKTLAPLLWSDRRHLEVIREPLVVSRE